MIWRMYIRFEISQEQVENAKKVFYRGIDKCPHAKVLWMDSVKLFSEHMTLQDMRQQFDLILEKEIHMRSSIEEFVQFAKV